jgi:molybdate transport system substrate-binding protein
MMLLVLCLAGGQFSHADTLTLAAGAGYKKPVMEHCSRFEELSGIHTEALFGNMRQVLSQAEQSDRVALVVGDRAFLEQSDRFADFVRYDPIVIVAGIVKGHAEEAAVTAFLNYLASSEAHAVLTRHGL